MNKILIKLKFASFLRRISHRKEFKTSWILKEMHFKKTLRMKRALKNLERAIFDKSGLFLLKILVKSKLMIFNTLIWAKNNSLWSKMFPLFFCDYGAKVLVFRKRAEKITSESRYLAGEPKHFLFAIVYVFII